MHLFYLGKGLSVKTMLADAVLLPIVFPIAGERLFESVHVRISFDFHHPSVTRFTALADDALGNVETPLANVSCEFASQFAAVNNTCNRQVCEMVNKQVRSQKTSGNLDVEKDKLFWVVGFVFTGKRIGTEVFGERNDFG